MLLILLCAILSPGLAQKPCQSDTDCHSKYYKPEHQLLCLNNSCSCPSSYNKVVYIKGFEFCYPEITNTGKPCGDDHDCLWGLGKCLPDLDPTTNSTSSCWECTVGSPSSVVNGSFTCDGDSSTNSWCYIHEGAPYRYFYSRKCTSDKMKCAVERGRSSKCTCKEGFYPNPNFYCSPIPKPGDQCDFPDDCSIGLKTYGYTTCSNGTCTCLNGTFDPDLNVCVTKPYGLCALDVNCPSGSRCARNAEGQRCVCNGDYVNGRDGECFRYLYEKECIQDPDEKTKRGLVYQGLECIDDKYQCQHITQEIYEVAVGDRWKGSRHRCVALVGGDCVDLCAPGAKCLNLTGQEFRCQCDEGHSPTPEDKCLKHVNFLENCSDNCNPYAGLVCKRRTCQCADEELRHDPLRKKCLSPQGHFCGTFVIDNGLFDKKTEVVLVECERGLECGRSKWPKISGLRCLVGGTNLSD